MRKNNLQSIYECFPPNINPPEQLIQLVKWISETANPDSGVFPGFEGNRLGDHWIENGSHLASQFGLFIHQADGTLAGYWFYEGCDIEKAPIVILGSGSGQGDVEVIANSIEDFASRIVEGKTGLYDFDGVLDEDNYDEGEDLIQLWGWDVRAWLDDLGIWLEETWGITPAMRQQFIKNDPKQDHPDLQEWFDRWSEEQIKIHKQSPIFPVLQKIHKILSKYLPESTEMYIKVLTSSLYCQEENVSQTETMMRSLLSEGSLPWVSADFDIQIVGSKFEIWRRGVEECLPIPESLELEPLFREIRLDSARKIPEQGLWFSSRVAVYPDGNVKISRFDKTKPTEFLGENPTIDDYRSDLSLFPRSAEFLPTWLNEMLTQGS